jgi:hypothetical protein
VAQIRRIARDFSEAFSLLRSAQHRAFNPLVGSSSLPRPTNENGTFMVSLGTDGVRNLAIRFVFVVI